MSLYLRQFLLQEWGIPSPIMYLLDRYLSILFLRIFSICFISISGLIIVVDTFTNLEEFLELAKSSGGLPSILASYYIPRIFLLFDQLAPVIALIAGICGMLWMRRSGELTAVEAGGIPVARLARPIIGCTLVLIGLSIANRELIIPKFRSQLAKNAQSWNDDAARPMIPQKDFSLGIWIRGATVVLNENRINQPVFQLPNELAETASEIRGEWAEFREANEQHPAGYLVHSISRPANIDQLRFPEFHQGNVVLTAADHQWLNPGSCFLASSVQPELLVNQQAFQRYASLNELTRSLRNPSVWFSNRQRVNVHGRIVRPALDLSILLIGLPLVISRRERNVFYATGLCLAVVLLILLGNMACQAAGAARWLTPASLAAWIPIMLIVPFAAISVRWLYR